MLKELTQVDSLIQQDHYLTQLATEFHLQRETLQQQLDSFKQAQKPQGTKATYPEEPRFEDFPETGAMEVPPEQQAITRRPLTQGEKAEQQLLYRLFNEPRLLYQLQEAHLTFLHEDYERIYQLFVTYFEQKGEFDVAGFVDHLDDPEIQNKVITIVTLNLPQESTEKEIRVLLRVLDKTRLADKINEKVILQQEAGRIGNTQLELELAVEIIDLRKQLKQTDIF